MKAPCEKPVIQIIVTNRCDVFHCSNCTQMLVHQAEPFHMTPGNFRAACESLRGWPEHRWEGRERFGPSWANHPNVVGVFGGNPCVHPQFEELCAIIAEVFPDPRSRGLWTNNALGHQGLIKRTFGYFNVNVHGNPRAAAVLRGAGVPVIPGSIHGASWHSPTLVAIRDMIGRPGGPRNEQEMWEAIEGCDINQKWSGAITQRRGELRAYFCEVAASFENMYDADSGLAVTAGWWRRPIADYARQIGLDPENPGAGWCPRCGIPLKLQGHRDVEQKDDVSQDHLARAELSLRGERIVLHQAASGVHTHEATDYMGYRR